MRSQAAHTAKKKAQQIFDLKSNHYPLLVRATKSNILKAYCWRSLILQGF